MLHYTLFMRKLLIMECIIEFFVKSFMRYYIFTFLLILASFRMFANAGRDSLIDIIQEYEKKINFETAGALFR